MTEAANRRHRFATMQPSLLLLASVLLLLLLGVSLDSLSPSVKFGGVTVSALLMIAWWIVRPGETSKAITASRPILKPLLGLILLQTLLVFRAPLLRPSFESEIQTIVLVLVYLFVLSSLNGSWKPRTWEDALVLTVVALSLVESILIAAWFRQWWAISGGRPIVPPTGYRASGLLLGHPNVLAGFISLILPILWVRVLDSNSLGQRLGRAALLVYLMVILFFTSSRGGWVASALGLIATSLVLIANRSTNINDAIRRMFGWLRRQPRWRLAAGVVLLGLAVYAGAWQITRTGHAPLSRSRLPVWTAAVAIFRDAPLLGHGPGSFPSLYALVSSYRELDIPHAHNLILQVLDESGLLGGALLAWLLGATLMTAGRGWLHGEPSTRTALAAYFGAGAALLSHQMIDYLFGPPLYMAASFVLLALMLHAVGRKSANDGSPKRGTGWLILLTALLPIAVLVCLRGAWAYWDGITAARLGAWPDATRTLCSGNPTVEEPLSAEACGLASTTMNRFHPGSREVASLTTAAGGDPYWGYHLSNLAMIQYSTGQRADAIASMDRAIAAMPSEAGLRIMRGYLEAERGNEVLAADFYYQALRSDPSLWWDDFFQLSPERLPESFDGITANLTDSGLLLWQATAELRSGNFERAMALTDEAERRMPRNSEVYALRAEFDLDQGALESAERMAKIGLFIRPNDFQLNVLVAEIDERLGKMDRAREALTKAADAIRFSTRSRRYYYAAYGRSSLPIDQVPAAFRAAPFPGFLELLTRAGHEPAWTAGAQPDQRTAWSDAAELLARWRAPVDLP